jgi:hypothetical protein
MEWAPGLQTLRRQNGTNPGFKLDDFKRLKRRLLTLSAMLLAAGTPAQTSTAQAGVGYFPVPLGEPQDGAQTLQGETFPESRWGSGPLRARATDSELEPMREYQGGGRSPASVTARRQSDAGGGELATIDREIQSASSRPNEALPGDPLKPNPAKNGVQEIAVIAGDLGFFPKKIFVNRDMPVRLYVTGASRKNLCVLIDAFQVRRQVKSQKVEEVSFTPGTPGTFRMHCPINGIEGTLVVRELPAATSLAGGPSVAAGGLNIGE